MLICAISSLLWKQFYVAKCYKIIWAILTNETPLGFSNKKWKILRNLIFFNWTISVGDSRHLIGLFRYVWFMAEFFKKSSYLKKAHFWDSEYENPDFSLCNVYISNPYWSIRHGKVNLYIRQYWIIKLEHNFLYT